MRLPRRWRTLCWRYEKTACSNWVGLGGKLLTMLFEVTYPTRHTDAFAGTGFVHGGVLLALTELAYADFERHCGVTKPAHVVAVQRSTEAQYSAPLRWQEGVVIRVRTTRAEPHGFEQEFALRSAADQRAIATITHRWVWLDTETGKRVALPEEVQRQFYDGAPA